MKTIFLIITFTFFFYSLTLAQQADEVIKKYVEVSFKGDVSKIVCLLRKGTYISSLPKSKISNFTTYAKNDGRRKNEIKTDNHVTIICYDGKEEVVTSNGIIMEYPDLKVKNDKYDTILKAKYPAKQEFIDYLADAFVEGTSRKFELIGKEVIDKQECYVLKSDTYLQDKVVYCYVTTDKYLLLRSKFLHLIGESVSETDFEDYREVDGFLFPFTMKIHSYQVDGERYKSFTGVRYNEIIINPKIDDSIFDCSKPNKITIKE